jgi:tetratricopeptide (TPR) repeat protein
LGQVYIYQENWSAAQICLSRSQILYDATGSDDYLSELDRRWGEYYLNMGDLDLALDHAKKAVDLASAQEERLDMGIGFRVLGEVHRRRNDFEAAEIAMLQSQRLLDDLGSEFEAAKTRLSLTQLAIAAGKDVDSDLLQKAITTFKKLGASAELKLTSDLVNHLGELG